MEADRYTVINCSYDGLADKMRACDALFLRYFVRSDSIGSCWLYAFFDEAGMRNYLAGYYDDEEDDDK